MVDSEFRTYNYIEKVLGELGWDTRNPARSGGGDPSIHRENFAVMTPC